MKLETGLVADMVGLIKAFGACCSVLKNVHAKIFSGMRKCRKPARELCVKREPGRNTEVQSESLARSLKHREPMREEMKAGVGKKKLHR